VIRKIFLSLTTDHRPLTTFSMSDSEMYKQRGFANRVGFGARAALLIVDFINAFTDVSCPLGSNLDEEIKATKRILDVFREKNLPVHFTTTAYDEAFVSAGVFIKKVPSLAHLKTGTPLVEIDARLTPQTGEVVWTKQYASAFFGTALAAALTAQKVDTLIIAGCTTSGCVRASAVDACQNGFRAIVVREAVGDRSNAAHEANLFDLDAKYADVVSLDETLERLKK
jgi:maleamate amidohydrolase